MQDGVDGPAPREWSEDEERALRLWIALARCYASMARGVAGKIAGYGLTPAQFGILEALYHLGPLPLGELADKLLVTGGNVTYVMDRLEELGLAHRDRSGSDKRVVQARLTEEGRALLAGVFPSHAAYIRSLTESLDESEQDQLRALLRKLGKAAAAVE